MGTRYLESAGYNLIGDGTGSGWTPATGDQVGTAATPIDPLLGPLQNNGGPTETHALLAGSPAINAGDPSFAGPPDFDQRGPGFDRVLDGRIDIGAFEVANGPPTGILLSNAVVDENSPSGTLIGTLTAVDPNAGDTFTFSEVLDADGRFAVVGDELRVDGPLDFENQTSHDVTLRVTDGGGLSFDQLFTISVNDVNEDPTVDAATFNVDENSPDTTSVGTATASDPDAGDSVTFSITGGNTGGAFAINGTAGEITVNNSAALDFETTPTFNLTVQAEDRGTLTGTATITINLNNIDPVDDTLAVIDAVQDLKDSGVLSNGEANPILNHLDQAGEDWNKGKTAHAVQKLEQARDEIQDLIDDGDLTSALGQPLIDTINDLITEIL